MGLEGDRIWIYWMFFMTTFLHIHHSLLAKLGRWGWLMRTRLAWKKSQKTLDTSQILHWNKTRNTKSVGKGLNHGIQGTAMEPTVICAPLQTWYRTMSSLPEGSWDGVKSIPRCTSYHVPVCYLETRQNTPYLYWGSFTTDRSDIVRTIQSLIPRSWSWFTGKTPSHLRMWQAVWKLFSSSTPGPLPFS